MLEGSWNPLQEAQLLLLVLDYNLKEAASLDTSTSEEDLELAKNTTQNDLITAYHARVCQRDTLAQWRHAICRQYRYESEPVDPKRFAIFSKLAVAKGDKYPNAPLPQAPDCLVKEGGCPLCGRTIDLKACSRCKQVKYCCRDHQRLDWKLGHKKVCDPALATTG